MPCVAVKKTTSLSKFHRIKTSSKGSTLPTSIYADTVASFMVRFKGTVDVIKMKKKQVGERPVGRYDMQLSRAITDKYHKNEAFPLVKYIRRYV